MVAFEKYFHCQFPQKISVILKYRRFSYWRFCIEKSCLETVIIPYQILPKSHAVMQNYIFIVIPSDTTKNVPKTNW